MTVKAYGFAYPVTLGDIKTGDLLVVALGDGERVVGVSFKTEHDSGIAVLWSNRDTEVPRAEDRDARWVYARIDGELVVEPVDVQDAFQVPLKVSANTGLMVTSDGRVGVSMDVDNFGTAARAHLDLSTGERLERSSATGMISDYKLFVQQEGRKDRWPLVDLIP